MNNGRALTALVSNGEQTLRTDGINIGANTSAATKDPI